MTLLSTATKNRLRSVYASRIHNTAYTVRKKSGTVVNQANPMFEGVKEAQFTAYTDFYASVYDILSGKVNRMFAERGAPEILAELGVHQQDVRVVVYVCDTDLTSNTPTVPNNLEVDEEILIDSEWWRVIKVVADSEGVQHTALAVR